jgi:hypothetical protein
LLVIASIILLIASVPRIGVLAIGSSILLPFSIFIALISIVRLSFFKPRLFLFVIPLFLVVMGHVLIPVRRFIPLLGVILSWLAAVFSLGRGREPGRVLSLLGRVILLVVWIWIIIVLRTAWLLLLLVLPVVLTLGRTAVVILGRVVGGGVAGIAGPVALLVLVSIEVLRGKGVWRTSHVPHSRRVTLAGRAVEPLPLPTVNVL